MLPLPVSPPGKDSPHGERSRNRCRRRWRGWLLWPAMMAALAYPAAWGVAQPRIVMPGVEPSTSSDAGVYLPTDRTISRAITRAQQRIAAREFHQPLNFLQEVLERGEDAFLDPSDALAERSGLKATARRMIGELPAEGRDVYELLYGATARRQLQAALDGGDPEGVAQVVRKYFHTSAGYEAALVLAHIEADLGHHSAAAHIYEELLGAPRAAAAFEPQLSVLGAVNHYVAGRDDAAAKLLESLAARFPAGTIELAGKKLPVPGRQADMRAWLAEQLGTPAGGIRAATEWATLRGNPARNASHPGGGPHLQARWQARVVNEPNLEAFLASRYEQFQDRGQPAIPTWRPIAVGDVVLMRTPRNVVAVDWLSGKRVWETREESQGRRGRESLEFTDVEEEESVGPSHPLEQRVWRDSLAASLSSDGQRVYTLRDLSPPPYENAAAWQMAPMFGGGAGDATPITNQLAAYELATEGKLVWELDGSRTNRPLAGAFFLGAPLAIDNTLYVLAEIRSAVYLVALEPKTGQLKWQQQLLGLEMGISLDPARRLVGATPSYADGILVCPTAAGGIIGIDIVRREFAWVYRYPRDSSPTDIRGQIFGSGGPVMRTSDRWGDGSAIVADGRVFVTPQESSELHCLDLRTGELLWKQPWNDGLYVACVDDGRLLVVKNQSVEALQVQDGTPAWEESGPSFSAGAMPAGQGYLSEGVYYFPLSNGEVAAVDMSDGGLATSAPTQHSAPLGNLICHRGSVLSQSALVLDKFEQVELLERRALAALEKDGSDTTALRELAELRRLEGESVKAIELLKRAHRLSPADPAIREMLAGALLEGLAADYAAYREDVPQLWELVVGREQKIELLHLEATGLQRLGQPAEAYEKCLRLAELTAGQPVELQVSRNHSARSDRWISRRLAGLWEQATGDERRQMAESLVTARARLDEAPTLDAFRHYLSVFGQLPGAEEVRLALVDKLLERRYLEEAELELLKLYASGLAPYQAAAAGRMARLLAGAERPDEAAAYAAELVHRWPDTPAGNGLTGRQWFEQLVEEHSSLAPRAEGRGWPQGKISAEVVRVSTPARERFSREQIVERQAGYRKLRIEQDFWPVAEATQWYLVTDGTQLIGRNRDGDEIHRLGIDSNTARQLDSSVVYAARVGPLLYLSLGSQVMALDARAGSESSGESLWQRRQLRSAEQSSAEARRRRITRRVNIYHPWSGRRRVSAASRMVGGAIGPATPHGVVVQQRDALTCLDPITGEPIWTRTDVQAGCELFGDGEFLFVADDEEGIAEMFSMIDGHRLGRRELVGFPWMLTAGRNVAHQGTRVNNNQRRMFLRVTDMESDEVLFDGDYGITTRMSVVEPQHVAVYDPDGTFHLIDVRSGEVVIDQRLRAIRQPLRLETVRCDGDLFVFISERAQQQRNRPIGLDYPMFNGLVYAFDLRSGEPRWANPAVVRNRGISLAQPHNLPLLVFVDREMTQTAGGGSSQLRLLCLDKQTGETIYRNDNLRDTAGTRFRIRSQLGEEPSVQVDLGTRELRLAFSDSPRPPAPPSHDDVESAREFEERGLWGVGRRLSEALQGSGDRPGGSAPQGADAEPAAPEIEHADPRQLREEFDDD